MKQFKYMVSRPDWLNFDKLLTQNLCGSDPVDMSDPLVAISYDTRGYFPPRTPSVETS